MANLRTQDFSYDLPKDMIAYSPADRRDEARLMVVPRATGAVRHTRFKHVARYLRRGDLLVVNETRVLRARLKGEKKGTCGKTDLLLVREAGPGLWEALVTPSRRIHPGTEILLAAGYTCRIAERLPGGKRLVDFAGQDVMRILTEIGAVPLPPYIKRAPMASDCERYQTVYARKDGSVAAPTAGLHFTDGLLAAIGRKGVDVARLTLHVGPGTFRPVKEDDPSRHVLEPEYFEMDDACCRKVNSARARGARIVAVGTTSVRALETAAQEGTAGALLPTGGAKGWTAKFIYAPYRFKAVDVLITNFHLPCSTLLMLVAAFAGRKRILEAYRQAIERNYRFYSYGDAMIIL